MIQSYKHCLDEERTKNEWIDISRTRLNTHFCKIFAWFAVFRGILALGSFSLIPFNDVFQQEGKIKRKKKCLHYSFQITFNNTSIQFYFTELQSGTAGMLHINTCSVHKFILVCPKTSSSNQQIIYNYVMWRVWIIFTVTLRFWHIELLSCRKAFINTSTCSAGALTVDPETCADTSRGTLFHPKLQIWFVLRLEGRSKRRNIPIFRNNIRRWKREEKSICLQICSGKDFFTISVFLL